jgi:SH3-like domain-containing protein
LDTDELFSWQAKAMTLLRCVPVLAVAGLIVLIGVSQADAAGDGGVGPVSGLTVPRFVSLKADRVNVRRGPNKDDDVSWVYTRAGLPVEITAEYENWRRVRDWEGAEGWVYDSLLSGRRTALVTSKSKSAGDFVSIFVSADAHSDIAARLQPGVLGTVKQCNNSWCRIAGDGFDGWIPEERLWGVYPNEDLD